MQSGKFYVGRLQESLPNDVVNKITHIALEEDENGNFLEIDRQPVNLLDEFYCSVKLSDPTSWFRYAFYCEQENLGYSMPILVDDIADIILSIRESLGDTKEPPAFSDEEYYQSLRFAFRQFRGSDHFIIRSEDIPPLELLVRKDFALKIAYDYAKYYQLESQTGAKLNQSEVMTHYLQMADSLERAFQAAQGRLNMGSGGYNDSGIITQMPKANGTKIAKRPHHSRSLGGGLRNVKKYSPTIYPPYIY